MPLQHFILLFINSTAFHCYHKWFRNYNKGLIQTFSALFGPFPGDTIFHSPVAFGLSLDYSTFRQGLKTLFCFYKSLNCTPQNNNTMHWHVFIIYIYNEDILHFKGIIVQPFSWPCSRASEQLQATADLLIYKSRWIINNDSLLFVDQSISHNLPMIHCGFDPLEHGHGLHHRITSDVANLNCLLWVLQIC